MITALETLAPLARKYHAQGLLNTEIAGLLSASPIQIARALKVDITHTVQAKVRDIEKLQNMEFASALCAQSDPEIFFPVQGDRVNVRLAKKICSSCIHKSDCLEQAMANNEDYGIFGGESAIERKHLRSKRYKAAKAAKAAAKIAAA